MSIIPYNPESTDTVLTVPVQPCTALQTLLFVLVNKGNNLNKVCLSDI